MARYLLTFILVANPIFAQNAGPAASGEIAMTSAALRSESRGYVAWEYVPLSSLQIPASGIVAGIQMHPTHALELRHSEGEMRLSSALAKYGIATRVDLGLSDEASSEEKEAEFQLNETYQKVQKLKIFHSTTSARVKSHWGNSTFSVFGFGYRDIGVEYPIHEVSDVEGLESGVWIRRPGLELGLGNQWQWRHAHFGITWLHGFFPFAYFLDPGSIYRIRDGNPEDINTYSALPNLALLQLQSGLVF